MTEARFGFVHPQEGDLVVTGLNEGIEDVMDLLNTQHTSESSLRTQNSARHKHQMRTSSHVDPDVRDLLVDDERLDSLGHGFHVLRPLRVVHAHRKEESGR